MPKASGCFSKVKNITGKTQFVQLPRELLSSYSWQKQRINCRRLIDFLMIENMSHAGMENGFLKATYDQLEIYGIHRRYILKAIGEAELLGLILVDHGHRLSYSQSRLNTFTLTFQKIKRLNESGQPYWIEPTNEWRKVSARHNKMEPDKTGHLNSRGHKYTA